MGIFKQNEDTTRPLIAALKSKQHLTNDQWKLLVENADLKFKTTTTEKTPLQYAFDTQSNIPANLIEYMIDNSDLRHKNKAGETPLITACKARKSQVEKNLNEGHWHKLFTKSNLKLGDNKGMDALSWAIKSDTPLNRRQWNYLIHNSDLTRAAQGNIDALMLAMAHKRQNLGQDQLQKLIEFSDTNRQTHSGRTAFSIAISSMIDKTNDKRLELDEKTFEMLKSKSNIEQARNSLSKNEKHDFDDLVSHFKAFPYINKPHEAFKYGKLLSEADKDFLIYDVRNFHKEDENGDLPIYSLLKNFKESGYKEKHLDIVLYHTDLHHINKHNTTLIDSLPDFNLPKHIEERVLDEHKTQASFYSKKNIETQQKSKLMELLEDNLKSKQTHILKPKM